jgi:RimJ/RimL family protein N-acetyltransferase
MRLDVPALSDDVVTLRPVDRDDLDAIVDACQDPEIPRFTRVPTPYSRRDAEAFVEASEAGWADGTSACFSVVGTGDGVLLGSVGVHRIPDDRSVAEIGYWVAQHARRRGIATRALRLASLWAVVDLGIRRLELMADIENVGSQAVAEAAGFTREGVLRSYFAHRRGLLDVVMYSLLPSDLAQG